MALVLGHSQVKYVAEVFKNDRLVTLCYPGYRVRDFIEETTPFDVIPFVSVVAVVVGANDLPKSTPDDIVHDVQTLCDEIRSVNPSVTVILMEILPRAQNLFPGCRLTQQFISKFNAGATSVNDRLRKMARLTRNVEFVELREFYTSAGPNRKMLSRDGLHLSLHGTDVVACQLEKAIVDCLNSSTRVTRELSQSSTQPLPRIVEGPRRYSDVAATPVSPPTPAPVTTRSPPAPEPVTTRSPPASTPVTTRSPPAPAPVTTRSPPAPAPVTTRSPPAPAPVTTRSPPAPAPVTTRSPPAPEPVTTRSPPASTPVTARSPPASSPAIRSSRTAADIEIDHIIQWIDGELNEKPISLSGGGLEAVVFNVKETVLTTKEAETILRDCYENKPCNISLTMPISANGGEIYVVDTQALKNRNDLFVDKYVWKNDGRKKYPGKNPILYKSLFKIRLPDKTSSKAFSKSMYELIEHDRFVIIHYIGDQNVFEPFSHGNSKKSNRVFKRTLPSVIDDIKSNADDMIATANYVYKQSRAKAEKGIDLGIKTAANLGQVKNHMYKARRDKKLSNDDLYNLLQISYELEDFTKQIDIFPSLVCISGLKEILAEFNELLMFDNSNDRVKMYYDTTYKLGEVFVSILSYQQIIFEGAPTIPIAFMMHERRDTKFHERFFSVLKEHVSNLSKTTNPIICDREPGLKSAINSVLPNIPIVHCWLHLKKDVKIWLQKHQATQDDLSVYTNHIDTLLRSESENSFLEKLDELEIVWSTEFRNYFHKHIKQSILDHCGRWLLEQIGIYNYYSGITTNPAESVNNVLKSVQKRRELPLDMINVTFYFLQQYHHIEMQCGRAGFGTMTLKKEYEYAKLNADDITVSQMVGTPEEIIKLAKSRLDQCRTKIVNIEDNNEDNSTVHRDDQHTILSTEAPSESVDLNSENNSEILADLNDRDMTILDDKTASERKGREKLVTQKMLAEQLIHENKIHWIASMNTYVVEGIKGSKRVVTMAPKETCSCPSTGLCYHILAVKTAFNLNTGANVKTIKNLSLLRKNSKPRVAKKTGQKKPKKSDFEIIAAPDSIQKTQNSLITPKSTNKKRKPENQCSTARKKIRFDDKLEETVDPLPCILEDSFEIRLSDIEDTSLWTKKYNLNFKDKILIEESTGWLNDKIINASQKILYEQFSQTFGLQDTLLVPHFLDDKNKWDTSKSFTKQDTPGAQIHHNGKSHWVLSFRTDNSQPVTVIDSLKSSNTVNSSLSIQLSQLYHCDQSSDQITIHVPFVQQQDNGSDCGVFAIAYLTELLHSNFNTNLSNVRFDKTLMRQHLLTCIENDFFNVFPKISKMPKMPSAPPKASKIRVYCNCKLPDFVENMVRCSNTSCRLKWYHMSCVGLQSAEDDFLCTHCSW